MLCDSWFTCFELIKFIIRRRIKCHLLGMVKNGTTKHTFNDKEFTTKEIARLLVKKWLLKRSNLLGYYHSSAIVIYKGIEIKFFFIKASKRGTYNIYWPLIRHWISSDRKGYATTDRKRVYIAGNHRVITRDSWNFELRFRGVNSRIGVWKSRTCKIH